MARMLVIYNPAQDTASSDKHYLEVHVQLAKNLPGLRKYEVSRGAITALAGGEAYMIAELHFDDLAAIRAAFASEVGKACGADRQNFAPDPTAFQMFLLGVPRAGPGARVHDEAYAVRPTGGRAASKRGLAPRPPGARQDSK